MPKPIPTPKGYVLNPPRTAPPPGPPRRNTYVPQPTTDLTANPNRSGSDSNGVQPDTRYWFQKIYDNAAAPVTAQDRAGHNVVTNGFQTLGRGFLQLGVPLVHPVKTAHALPRMAEDAVGSVLDYEVGPMTYELKTGRTNLATNIGMGMVDDAKKEGYYAPLDLLGQFAGGEGASMGLRGAGTLLRPVVRSSAVGLVKNLIKPSVADLSIGDQPAQALLRQSGGVRSWSLDGLRKRSEANAARLEGPIRQAAARAPRGNANVLGEVANPFNSALRRAAQSNRRALVDSLKEAKQGYLRDLIYDPIAEEMVDNGPRNLTSMRPEDLFDLQRRVGEDAGWNNQPFEEEVNGARGQVFGGLKNRLDQIDPNLKLLNEKYGNMRAGINAIRRRTRSADRPPSIGLNDVLVASGTVAAGGGFPAVATAIGGRKLLSSIPLQTAGADALWQLSRSGLRPLSRSPYGLFFANPQRQNYR